MLRITAYAQKLLDGLDEVDFIDTREGAAAQLDRPHARALRWISDRLCPVRKCAVYTTRPDTLFRRDLHGACRPSIR